MNTMNDSTIRVRFAPSPTGYLHVGGLRTALYNYLFAKHHHGVFVLRIEDTDRSRFVEGAAENLLETLKWVGLHYSEGPDAGGEYGPYIQSQRTELYRKYAFELLENGWAYRSFTTPEELARMREGGAPYTETPDPGRDRDLREDEIRERLYQGLPYTIRLKVPRAGEVSFSDLIRGEITIGHDAIDDQVLLKSDGFPTYHLANVIDDHFMGITHVIRGEEWLPSTPKHILLYRAFGWELPQFAHLPLLLNPDKTKLSKRQGDVAVEDYRKKGYLPEALLNFVALLGWGPTDDRELFTLDDLVSEFSLDRVGKSGSVFDIQKLNWFNGQYLRNLPLERRTELCSPHLAASGYISADPETESSIVDALTKYLTFPGDIVEHAAVFFETDAEPEDAEARQALLEPTTPQVLETLLDSAGNLTDWNRDTFKNAMSEVQKTPGVKGKNLFMPVRVALTGRKHGPDIPVIAEIFGKDKCLERLSRRLQGR